MFQMADCWVPIYRLSRDRKFHYAMLGGFACLLYTNTFSIGIESTEFNQQFYLKHGTVKKCFLYI